MSVRTTVFALIERIRQGEKGNFPPLTEDLALLESGLDSLGIAVLVTQLEDTLGVDPFTESDIIAPPVTIGEFVRLYENGAKSD